MSWDNLKDPSYEGGYAGTPYPELVEHILDDADYRELRTPDTDAGTRVVFDSGTDTEHIESVKEELSGEIGDRYGSELLLQKIGGGAATEIYEALWR